MSEKLPLSLINPDSLINPEPDISVDSDTTLSSESNPGKSDTTLSSESNPGKSDTTFSSEPSPRPLTRDEILGNTIFILATCHGNLYVTKSSTDESPKPQLIKCNLRNFKKKNVVQKGCAGYNFYTHKRNILKYKDPNAPRTPREIQDRSISELTKYVNSLSSSEKEDLKKEMSRIYNSLDIVNISYPLLILLINEYIDNGGNLGCTYPTFPKLSDVHKNSIVVADLLQNKQTYSSDYALDTISCEIQEDKTEYWNNIYTRDNDSDTNLFISFALGKQLKLYDLLLVDDLLRLHNDLSGFLGYESIIINFIIKVQQERSDPSTRPVKLRYIFLHEIFYIVEFIQNRLSKESVIFFDLSCKNIYGDDNPSDYKKGKEDVAKLMSSDEKTDWETVGYGGYHNNKSKRKYNKSKRII